MTIRNEFISKQFVLAGSAIFTIETPERHYTFLVDKVEPTANFPKPAWFVKLLTGPDNTGDYTYLGKLDDFTGQLILTGKSALPADAFPVRLLNRVLARVWTGDHKAYMAHGYRTHHEGRCGKCGRRLTVPASINSGIGPECAKQMAGAVKEIEADLRESYAAKAEAARARYKQKWEAERQLADALAANPAATIEVQRADGTWVTA